MAKRLTDTEKWKKPFIRSLPTEYKLFWIYLIDDINHAGIWQVDKEITELRLGTKLSLDKARGLFLEKVVVFDNGAKWFIPDFIKFQYGELREGNKIHNSVIKELKKYNLLEHVKGYLTLKDKDKDKDSEEEKGDWLKLKRQELTAIIAPFVEKYGKELCNDFWYYWGQPHKTLKILRYESEDFFDVDARLRTFKKRAK